MNLSVIQTENFPVDYSSLGCYISANGDLIDIITPLTEKLQNNFIEVPSPGWIELMIKDMRKDEIIGEVTFQVQEYAGSGAHWFELNSELANRPKVLISFNNFLSSPFKISNSPQKCELLHKINELSTTVLELECKLDMSEERKNAEILNKTQEFEEIKAEKDGMIEQLNVKLNNTFAIVNDVMQQKTHTMKLYDKEHEKARMLEEKLADMQGKYDDFVCKTRNIEIQYTNDLILLQEELSKTRETLNSEYCLKSMRESLISQLSYKLNRLKGQNPNERLLMRSEDIRKQLELSEKQKNQLSALLDQAENELHSKKVCKSCEEKSREIEFLSSYMQELKLKFYKAEEDYGLLAKEQESQILVKDKRISDMKNEITEKANLLKTTSMSLSQKTMECSSLAKENKEVIEECTELKQRIITLTKAMETLERELTEIKCKSITDKKIERIKLDDIDFSLEKYLGDQGIENLFVKLAHGVYLYGTKRVNISIRKDNRLICRTGGGYMAIDQFLKLYQNTEIEEISKYVKKQSLFLSQGSSPIKTLMRRSASNTPKAKLLNPSHKENVTERSFEKKILDKLKVVYPLKDKNFTPVIKKHANK